MQKTNIPGFSSKIIRIYLLGASTLLAFYMYAFHAGTMLTENALMERRINIVSPFHFERYKNGERGVLKVDPLLILYEEHSLLPVHIRNKINPQWTGSTQVLLDDESEFQVFAARLHTNELHKIVYAVENANAVEWDDKKLVLIELTIGLIGLVLFLLTALYMVRAAKRIAMPFLKLAQQLESDSLNNFEPICPVGEKSTELQQIIKGLNTYRSGLAVQLEREKSFTRYVSHELRTPMMIIKGAISNLRQDSISNLRQDPISNLRQDSISNLRQDPISNLRQDSISSPGQSPVSNIPQDSNTRSNKAIDKIEKATAQMQELTQTFLMLAREIDESREKASIDDDFLLQVQHELEHSIEANQINFQWQLSRAFELSVQPLLLKAVLLNVLKNAFACSVNGNVNLFVCNTGIEVIDDGVGLEAKPRSYEGFGVGLVLVQDICKKYGWQFSLENNAAQGCTACVKF